MNTTATNDDQRDQKLNAILLTLVKGLERGQTPDRKEWYSRYPEFAAELEEFFAARDCVKRLSPAALSVPQPPSPSPDLGTLGDFRLLREVGRGGMGIVYEAQQISLDRCVALKVLPFAAGLDPRQIQRFKNEAHAAALLHHPHIVPIYFVGCERGVHFYAMQFIQGRSLAGMIQELRHPATEHGDPLPSSQVKDSPTARLPSKAASTGPNAVQTIANAGASTARSTGKPGYFRRMAQLGIEACTALEHAHQMGVVHRDIKPANLLLDINGSLWVTDFGVVLLQRSEGMTTTGELVGTLRYMSPEQAGTEKGHVDHRTDVYSLGATLYEMLTLEPAFPGADPNTILRQIAGEDPRPPRQVDRAVPVELELIVLKALAKSPSERYASAQEFADDLRRFLEDKPVRATRPSLTDQAIKWSRRHKAVVLSGIILLALTTLGLLGSTVMINRAYKGEILKAKEAEKNLAHARRVVDFLTLISTEELNDNPEFLPVRQKLLNAALEYYQQFIDEHQNDATIREELDASSLRVQQILDVLAAQQEYTQIMLRAMLLENEAVQKDLRLSPNQKDKIWDMAAQLKDQRRQALTISLKLSANERSDKFKELAASQDKYLTVILKPDQIKRLKQIALQQHGVHAFAETEIATALGLSPDQKIQIRPLLVEASLRQKEINTQVMNPQEAEHKARKITTDTEATILALLTPDQKTTWKEIAGAPFMDRVGFIPLSGFGPPEDGRPPPPPKFGKGPRFDGPGGGLPNDEWRKGPKGPKDGPKDDGRFGPKKKKF